jgi:hypothetical protein
VGLFFGLWKVSAEKGDLLEELGDFDNNLLWIFVLRI